MEQDSTVTLQKRQAKEEVKPARSGPVVEQTAGRSRSAKVKVRAKTKEKAAASLKAEAEVAESAAMPELLKQNEEEKEVNVACKPPLSRGKRNAELGRRGEDAAARFLDRRGYEIIERNWTCIAGEADIIARDGEALVFVEVKTRSSTERGLPSEAVDAEKRDRYERIAALFLQNYAVVDVPVRFDVVALVVVAPDRALVRHHINAFAAG